MVEPTPAATSAAAPLESGGATLVELLNFRSAIGRHDSWKAEWVREEGEDMIEGKGNPTAGLQSFGRHTRFSESDTETLQNSPNFACSGTAFGYFHNKIRTSRGEQEKS